MEVPTLLIIDHILNFFRLKQKIILFCWLRAELSKRMMKRPSDAFGDFLSALPDYEKNSNLSAMPATPEAVAFERGVRPIMKIVLPEKAQAVLRFRPPAKLKARIEELAEKSTEGRLTSSEKAEYAGYVRANKFVAILQRQARQLASAKS